MSATAVTASRTALMREDNDDYSSRTLLDLLTTEKTDGPDDHSTNTVTVTTTPQQQAPTRSDGSQTTRWTTVKQRLGFKSIICCRGGWGAHHHNSSSPSAALLPAQYDSDADEESPPPAGVNLAAALAEERQFRQLTAVPLSELEVGGRSGVPGTPAKVSLMRLMAEAGAQEETVEDGGGCVICMERKKGAAFIPCGHTFCRVCSREVWLHRGSCPLCNRPILDVLDLF